MMKLINADMTSTIQEWINPQPVTYERKNKTNRDILICHSCGGMMVPCSISKTFNHSGEEIEVKGLEGYQCVDCGERVFSSREVKKIEGFMRTLNDRPGAR